MNIRMSKAFTGKPYWVLEDNTGSWMITEAEARELYAQLGAALGDDVKADLLEACLAVVDYFTEPTWSGCYCRGCTKGAERRDLIQHEPGCAVGMAWQAATRAKGAE